MPDLIAHRPPNEGIDKGGNLLYEDKIKQLTIPQNIPNTIHLIWFGSWPPKADNSEAYLDNIKNWKVFNPNYSVKLWTSSASQTTDEQHEMQGFCAENGITLQDINENKSDNYTHVKEWLTSTKLGRPRFAAASDVLRLIVLEDEGGHYFDTDIKPLGPLCDDWTCTNGSYQLMNSYDLLSGCEEPNFEYCVMGSVPHDRLYRIANLVYARVHKHYMEKLRTHQDDSLVDKVDCIMRATGLHLSMAAQTFKLKPQIEKRGDNRCKLDREVVEGNLRGRIQVNFDRSYGREGLEVSRTEDTRNIISYFQEITSQAYSEAGHSLDINEGYIQEIWLRLNDTNKIIFQSMLVDMDLEDGEIPLLRDMHAFALEPTNRTYQNRYNAQINAALADASLTRQCLGNGLIALGVAILVAAGITFAVASACIAAPMAIVGVAALGCGFFVKRRQETQASADLSALQHAITG